MRVVTTWMSLSFAAFTPSLYTFLPFAAVRPNVPDQISVLVIILNLAFGSVVFNMLTGEHVPVLRLLTPAVTNQTGSWPARCCGMMNAPILCTNTTQLHTRHRERRQDTGEEFVVFQNNSASSIRLASSPTQYR